MNFRKFLTAGQEPNVGSRDRADPLRNPLGGRVFDMNCGWPMYRVPDADSFRYKCGLYQQSHGQQCDHNHVDGPMATSFILGCIRQRLVSLNLVTKLKARLQQLAAAELQQDRAQVQWISKMATIGTSPAGIEDCRSGIWHLQKTRISFARSRQWSRNSAVRRCRSNRRRGATPARTPRDVDSEVEAALRLADRLTEVGKTRRICAGQGGDRFGERQIVLDIQASSGEEANGKQNCRRCRDARDGLDRQWPCMPGQPIGTRSRERILGPLMRPREWWATFAHRVGTSRFRRGGNVVRKCQSGRLDLNQRPLGPEPSALARLSHAPRRRSM